MPARLSQLLQEALLIWIFRDPSSRVYAHYRNAVCHGHEKLPFEQAVVLELERVRVDSTWGYATRSRYADQIWRYLDYFRREQMVFILLEDLRDDPLKTINCMLRFMGATKIAGLEHELRSNQRRWIPRNLRLQNLGWRWIIDIGPLYRLLTRVNRREIDSYAPMSPSAREHLMDELAPQIDRLEEIIGRDLSSWRELPV